MNINTSGKEFYPSKGNELSPVCANSSSTALAKSAVRGVFGSSLLLAPLSIQHQEHTASEILPHLLLSNRGDAILDDVQSLLGSNIEYIVNCCGIKKRQRNSTLSSLPGVTVVRLDMKDEANFNLTEAFETVLPIVEKAKKEGKKCLIYCHAGMSRSVSLVVAYLVVCEQMSLIDALAHVKERHQIASPNPGFMAQLVALERALHKYQGGDGTNVTVCLERYKSDRFGDTEEFGGKYYYNTNNLYKVYTKSIYNPARGGHRRDVSGSTILLPLVESYLASAVTSVSPPDADTLLEESGLNKIWSPNNKTWPPTKYRHSRGHSRSQSLGSGPLLPLKETPDTETDQATSDAKFSPGLMSPPSAKKEHVRSLSTDLTPGAFSIDFFSDCLCAGATFLISPGAYAAKDNSPEKDYRSLMPKEMIDEDIENMGGVNNPIQMKNLITKRLPNL